jgi:transcriptional regulator with XRE-family HTH domain
MTIREALNKKLAEERISQSQLAKETGIQPALLSMLINGKRTPSLAVTKALYRKYPDMVDILLR